MARKGTTVNPKFRGADSPRVRQDEGGPFGGISEAQNRKNIWGQSLMLMRQLRKNKSGSSPL